MARRRSGTQGDQAPAHFRPTGKLALLLGAGGIRGCAHAGVLAVLEDVGLEADIVVGSSIGSIFGAAYAAGWDVEKIRRLTDLAPLRTVAEFYWNRLRFDGRTYIGSIMSELGRDTLIEDLPRKFAAMALDCATGQAVALTSGPLLQAVEASIALPGFAHPVQIGPRSYLDGGLRGPIPSSVVGDLGADSVIRVELVGNHPLQLAYRRVANSPLVSLVRKSEDRGAVSESWRITPTSEQETMPELIIAPQFYGLFCNAPLGIGFCSRRGKSAAVRLLRRSGVDSADGKISLAEGHVA